MTLEKAVLDLSAKEFTPGLKYVAVSRVKSLEGVLFDVPFDFEQLRHGQGKTAAARRLDWNRRTHQLLPIPSVDSSLALESNLYV